MIDGRLLKGAIIAESGGLKEFSEATGIPYATIDNVINHRNAPTWTTVARIVRNLRKQKPDQIYAIFFAENLASDASVAE